MSPTDLTLVEEFLNTVDERTFSRHGEQHVAADDLTSVESWSAWARPRGLLDAGGPPTPSDLAAAVALRTGLRETLTHHTDGEDRGAGFLNGFPLHLSPDPGGRLRLTAGSGVAALDIIVETVAAAVAGGDWHRLKLCAAPDCHWAFYDTSRNGGGRWCSMEVCGNRTKTRAYRRRQAG